MYRFVVVGLYLMAQTAFAHDPGLSAVHLQVRRDQIVALVTIAPADVPVVTDQLDLESLAADALEVQLDGRRILPNKLEATHLKDDDVQFDLTYSVTPAATLTVRAALFSKLPRGHRQYIIVSDEQGRALGQQILDATHDRLQVNLANTILAHRQAPTFLQFLTLGVEHILTGYDHLAFLFGLLIVGTGLRETVKIITSFTVAHSITLALATFGLVHVSPRITESLIAVSIIYVGVENLRRRDLMARWLLAFGFGLIHGLGFATALRDLGIGANGSAVAVPLVSFNLGVELGQLAIAAVILPIVWKLKSRPSFVPRLVPACSLVVAVMGGYWLIERTLLK